MLLRGYDVAAADAVRDIKGIMYFTVSSSHPRANACDG
jgi:hypothetical protein